MQRSPRKNVAEVEGIDDLLNIVFLAEGCFHWDSFEPVDIAAMITALGVVKARR
jgi:hypothetical protein